MTAIVKTARTTNVHWTKGGTGITNFDADRLPLYEAAIAAHGDPDLVIADEPMPPMTEGYALHDLGRLPGESRDLSEFWQVFYQLRGTA